MAEFINSTHPGWLILLWLFCAVTSALPLSKAFQYPDDCMNPLVIIHSLSGLILWFVAGSFMVAYSPANAKVSISVYDAVLMWGKVMAGLYLYLSLPLLLNGIKKATKTKIWQWLIA